MVLSAYQVFTCVQQAIWTAHYRNIFNSIFIIIVNIHNMLHKLNSQILLQNNNWYYVKFKGL